MEEEAEEAAEAGWWRLDADLWSAQAVAADAVRHTGTRKAYPTAVHGESQPAGARSHHSGAAIPPAPPGNVCAVCRLVGALNHDIASQSLCLWRKGWVGFLTR